MSEIKLDVNLNELFKLSYDFDNLQKALMRILGAMNDTNKKVHNQSMEIKHLKDQIDKRDGSIQDLTERIKDLEKKSKEHTGLIEENSDGISNHTSLLNNHTLRIEKLENITDDIQKKLDILGDGGLDLDAIQKLLDKMKDNFEDRFVLREDFLPFQSNCEDKFDQIENAHQKFREDIAKLFETKVDREEMKDMLNTLNDLVKEVEEAMKWKQPLVQVTNRIDKVEIQVKSLFDRLNNQREVTPPPIVENVPKEIIKIQEVKDDRPYVDPQEIQDLREALNRKADLSALKDLERYLLQRLDDLENGLSKRFADKKTTEKALKALEKQIKNLFDMLMNMEPGQAKTGEDDAMFAKRPLGGWSCASCAKDIVNLQSLPADYVPWSKWPLRDPTDRLAKSGQGFSRILTNIKPEFVSYNAHDSAGMDEMRTMSQEKLRPKKKKRRTRPASANRITFK